MKISTIETVLKCIRSRADNNKGIIQFGTYDIVALAAAGHVLNNTVLLEIAAVAAEKVLNDEVTTGNKTVSMQLLKLDRRSYEAIREAYKTLGKHYEPKQEVKITDEGNAILEHEPFPEECGDYEQLNKWLNSITID